MKYNYLTKDTSYWSSLSGPTTPKSFGLFCKEFRNLLQTMDFDEVIGFKTNQFTTLDRFGKDLNALFERMER